MQFVQQPITLAIKNFDDKTSKTKHTNKHGNLLPDSIRCIICGPSGCGKTNVIISLLEDPNGLRFENVYIYSMSLYQPKYLYIKSVLSQVEEIGFYTFSSNDDVIPPENAKVNSVFIFDDVITQKQNNIKSYFCMGRHKKIDCFYLTQSYTHVPKHLIRENTNLILLFKQDDLNLKHVFNDFGLSADMTFEIFKEMCQRCWIQKFDFLVIDIEQSTDNGKYRKGFDNFIKIDKS